MPGIDRLVRKGGPMASRNRLTWGVVAAVAMSGAVGAARPAPREVAAAASVASPHAPHQVAASLGRLPLRFEANQGQFDGRAQFAARGLQYAMWLTPTGSVLALQHGASQAVALELSL